MQEFKIISPTDFLRDSREVINKNFQSIATDFSGDTFPTQNLWPGMKCYRTDQKKLYFLYSTSEEVTGVTNNDWRLLIDFSEAGKAVVPYAENAENAEIAGKAKTDINGNAIHSNVVNRNTAYTVGAIVQHPDLPAGTFLRCTTAGTTAEISPEFSPNATVGMTYTDGGVTWTLDSYLPTSGGEIRDRIKFPIDDGNILDIGKNRDNNHGAWIRLLNSGQTDGVGIYFRDSADKTNPSSIFIGSYNNSKETMKIWLSPDLQTINDKPIVLSIDGKNADNSGNIALNGMTYKKLSSIKSVKGCFWADSNSGIDVTQIPAKFKDSDWNLWQIGMLSGNDKIQFCSSSSDIFIRGDDAVAGAESWTQSSWKRILTGHNTADYIVTNDNNGTTWYQKYYSGKIIQGGLVTVNGSTTTIVTFPVAFKTNVQSIQLTHYNSSATNNAGVGIEATGVTLTNFVARLWDSGNHQYYWMAVGR